MKIIGVDYEDGKAVGIDVLCEGDQRVHFVRASDAAEAARCKDCKFARMTSSGDCKYRGTCNVFEDYLAGMYGAGSMTVKDLMHLLADASNSNVRVYVETENGDNIPLEEIDYNDYHWGFVIGKVEAE